MHCQYVAEVLSSVSCQDALSWLPGVLFVFCGLSRAAGLFNNGAVDECHGAMSNTARECKRICHAGGVQEQQSPMLAGVNITTSKGPGQEQTPWWLRSVPGKHVLCHGEIS